MQITMHQIRDFKTDLSSGCAKSPRKILDIFYNFTSSTRKEGEGRIWWVIYLGEKTLMELSSYEKRKKRKLSDLINLFNLTSKWNASFPLVKNNCFLFVS